jgi:hypothetical protein
MTCSISKFLATFEKILKRLLSYTPIICLLAPQGLVCGPNRLNIFLLTKNSIYGIKKLNYARCKGAKKKNKTT